METTMIVYWVILGYWTRNGNYYSTCLGLRVFKGSANASGTEKVIMGLEHLAALEPKQP